MSNTGYKWLKYKAEVYANIEALAVRIQKLRGLERVNKTDAVAEAVKVMNEYLDKQESGKR